MKNIFKEIKAREERFNFLSSKEKLEYYIRFKESRLYIGSWKTYIIFGLIQIILMTTALINFHIGYLDEKQIALFGVLFIGFSRISILVMSCEIVVNLIGSGVDYFLKRKWLIDKGVIKK